MGVRCVILKPRHDDRLESGEQLVGGLAWSGCGRIETVEVSTDGGGSWQPVHLEEPRERWLWTRWSYRWQPTPGHYTLMARATDEQARTQPQTPWNLLRKNFDDVIPVEVDVS